MNLIKEFGTNFQLLARVLPSVLLLISPDETTQYNQADRNGNVNLMSICFLLQRFTKVVSASTGPGMLFLDGKFSFHIEYYSTILAFQTLSDYTTCVHTISDLQWAGTLLINLSYLVLLTI